MSCAGTHRLISSAITALEPSRNFCDNANCKHEADAPRVLTISSPPLPFPCGLAWPSASASLAASALSVTWCTPEGPSQHQPSRPHPMTDRRWGKYFSSPAQRWKWRGKLGDTYSKLALRAPRCNETPLPTVLTCMTHPILVSYSSLSRFSILLQCFLDSPPKETCNWIPVLVPALGKPKVR